MRLRKATPKEIDFACKRFHYAKCERLACVHSQRNKDALQDGATARLEGQ